MRIILDYRIPDPPRATLGRCVTFAAKLLGLALCTTMPLAVSVAGLYLQSVPFILAGAAVSGLCLASAMLLAAAAVEQFCDLRD